MARLFFALWPDAAAAPALDRLARDLVPVAGGRPVAPGKIHLTLAFLGEVPEDRIAAAQAIALAGKPFELKLDHVGSFRRARVAWAAPSAVPPELVRLQARLAGELRERGFELEERAFAPHLTLVRKLARALPRAPIEPIAWKATELALMRSELETGRYATVARWPLAG